MENEELNQRIRKARVTLVCSGLGILILTAWLFIKYYLFVGFASESIVDSVYDHLSYYFFDNEISQRIFFYFMMAQEGFFRFFIAYWALRKGKKDKKISQALIIVSIYFTVYIACYDLLEIYYTIRYFSLTSLFYCFLDFFLIYPLIQIDYNLIHLKKDYVIKNELKNMKKGDLENEF